MPRKLEPATASLAAALETRTIEGAPALTEHLPGDRVRCLACGHRCLILPGLDGICRVRHNRDGRLRVPHGYVAGLQIDPIEKKPFFHAFPGAPALSFGMLGCDFHCGYCQNWLTSQALRDPAALAGSREIEAGQLVELAQQHQVPVMVSTYNEPLITTEWALDVFRRARDHGIVCGYVSNGNATPEVLDHIRPWVQLYKVDLKSMRDAAYRSLGGKLDRVLQTIRGLHEREFWIEVVTLLVPGFNDSEAELSELTGFLADVSPDIPWHVTGFHPDYRMTAPRPTRAMDLLRAAELGRASGLRYVYAGNRPGQVADLESTRCPSCDEMLIERSGYRIHSYRLTDGGRCPSCRERIAGFWKPDWVVPAGARRADDRGPRQVPAEGG